MRKIVIVVGPLTDVKTHLINIIPNIDTHTHMRVIRVPDSNNKSVIVLGNSEEEVKDLDFDQIAKVIAPTEIKFEIPDIKFDVHAKFINDSFIEREKIQTRYVKEQMNYRSRALSKQTTLKRR